MRTRRSRLLLVASVALVVFIATPASSAVPTGTLTSVPPMLDLIAPDATLRAIVTVGEEPIEGFMFEGIPDGIGAMDGEVDGTVDVFVNHEQSRVAFGGLADLVDSSVSKLTLNNTTGGVVGASVAIPDSAGFLRFCSATMAGPNEGLDRHLFFTNEESPDVVPVPVGAPYGPDRAVAPARQGGYAVVLDPATGEYTPLASFGRHNHENDMVVPGGWDRIAVLSGDDTFFNSPLPDWSQLYLALARNENALDGDRSTLWAFRVTHTDEGRVRPGDAFNGANDYGDITDGDDWRGRFIRVPAAIAKGLTAKRPQDALEDWSNAHNVFQFIRVEDTAYNPNEPRVVYLADTGDRRMVPDPATGRLTRLPSSTTTIGDFPNGRVFRMEFHPDDPRRVVSFSILLNPDPAGLDDATVLHQPDNLGTSGNSLMIQEDTTQLPGSRVWLYDLSDASLTAVAIVEDIDWESSGIVDASEWFGAGTWLLDVQAHDVYMDEARGSPGVTLKRESGQLLLLTLPGS
jgi:hypothetical protein